MSWRALQLRMLIRNDEARIEHLTAWVNSFRPGDLAPVDMKERIQYAHDALMIHRSLLAKLSPAASSLVNVAPSSGAVQSGLPS